MKDETKCPLTKEWCYGATCAFWALKTQSHVDEKGMIQFTKNGEGYCIVRDFMLSMIAGSE